jgi:hypothetical protein
VGVLPLTANKALSPVVNSASTVLNTDSPESAASNYINNIINHSWDEAYFLTSNKFREEISKKAFRLQLENTGFDALSGCTVDNISVENNSARVALKFNCVDQINKKPANVILNYNVVKDIVGWRVEPPLNDFLAAKLETQSPLASKQENGVVFSLRYAVMYPATKSSSAYYRLRIEIDNTSNKALTWVLPASGTTESYLKDSVTNKMYLPLSGYGAMGKTGEAFAVLSKDGSPPVLTAAPGTKGSIFIYMEASPETVKQLDLVLGGFSFIDAVKSWEVSFNNIPFHYDVVPAD